MPAITITDPLVAGLVGVTAFGETLTTTWSMMLLALAALGGTVLGVVALVRRAELVAPAAVDQEQGSLGGGLPVAPDGRVRVAMRSRR